MRRNKKQVLLIVMLTLIVLALDQVSKQAVVHRLARGETITPIPALADYFQITRSQNSGAAFGLFQNAGDFFLVLAFVVVAGMLYYYPRLPANALITRVAMGLVCGGALGNAVDRIRQGHVIDFIHYQIPGLISNVSNIADHAIVVGVILIIFDNWRLERAQKRQLLAEQSETTDVADPAVK